MGHAGYAKGRKPDILCAAISVLTIGTVNSLKDLAGEHSDDYRAETGSQAEAVRRKGAAACSQTGQKYM